MKWKGHKRKWWWSKLQCLQLLGFSEKNTQNVSTDSQCPGYQSQQL